MRRDNTKENLRRVARIRKKPQSEAMLRASERIAWKIRTWMEERGFNNADLARVVDRKYGHVVSWTTGTQCFSLETIALIEEKLGIKILD